MEYIVKMNETFFYFREEEVLPRHFILSEFITLKFCFGIWLNVAAWFSHDWLVTNPLGILSTSKIDLSELG